MKINFDDLFSQTMSFSTLPPAFSDSTEYIPFKTQQKYQIESLAKSNKSSIRKYEVKDAQNNKESSFQLLQKLNKLTETAEQRLLPSKKHNKINIQQLTNKLYRPTLTKKHCSKNGHYKAKQQIVQGIIHRAHKRSKQTQFPRYVRLYNLNKFNRIKSLYRTQSHEAQFDRQNCLKINKTKISQSYLQNYVPFYDRLSSNINRSLQKLKFYEQNPQISCGKQRQLFKPLTIPDKYKNKVQSRYNKASSKQTKQSNQLEQILNSSLNTSFFSLDRSVEIVNQIQQHFFHKMNVIFNNEDEDYVSVNEQTIKMLTQTQFKILQNFIIQMESYPVKSYQFQSKLKQYYYNLPVNQKFQLRSHQTMKRKSTNNTSNLVSDRQQKSTASFKKKAQKAQSKYHKRVENFI